MKLVFLPRINLVIVRCWIRLAEDMCLMLNTRNLYLTREAVFGSDTDVIGRSHMERNLTRLYVFELYLIISVFDTVAGIRENYLFKAINLLSSSINFLLILR
jgi:hypothetical protein